MMPVLGEDASGARGDEQSLCKEGCLLERPCKEGVGIGRPAAPPLGKGTAKKGGQTCLVFLYRIVNKA